MSRDYIERLYTHEYIYVCVSNGYIILLSLFSFLNSAISTHLSYAYMNLSTWIWYTFLFTRY